MGLHPKFRVQLMTSFLTLRVKTRVWKFSLCYHQFLGHQVWSGDQQQQYQWELVSIAEFVLQHRITASAYVCCVEFQGICVACVFTLNR